MTRTVPLTLVLLVGGCAGAAHPPSLAVRSIELTADVVKRDPVAPPVKPIDGTLSTRIAALLADATAADAAFSTADDKGATAIRAGRAAKAGSERWIAGEQARSSLIAARQRTTEALATLDALVIRQVQAQANDVTTGGLTELQSAQAVVDAMVTRQAARLDDLSR